MCLITVVVLAANSCGTLPSCETDGGPRMATLHDLVQYVNPMCGAGAANAPAWATTRIDKALSAAANRGKISSSRGTGHFHCGIVDRNFNRQNCCAVPDVMKCAWRASRRRYLIV